MKGQQAARPCVVCNRKFVPNHGNQRSHRACSEARAVAMRKARDKNRNDRGRPKRPAPAVTAAFRPDFLLAYPEMKAQLERVAPAGNRLQARDYRSVDLEELPSLGRHLR